MESSEHKRISVKSDKRVAVGISDRGLVRPENEDAIYADAGARFFLLADGMGGHERGAEASRLAIDIIQRHFHPDTVAEELLDATDGCGLEPDVSCMQTLISLAVFNANKSIYELNRRAGLTRFMGTTVVGLVLVDSGHALWFHVGDSRLYRLRSSSLECLTTDHSAHMDWVLGGRKGAEPKRNIITRAIGPTPSVSESMAWDTMQRGDLFLLCSDGLTDMVPEAQILDILQGVVAVGEAAGNLIRAAKAAGGRDNISALVCRV